MKDSWGDCSFGVLVTAGEHEWRVEGEAMERSEGGLYCSDNFSTTVRASTYEEACELANEEAQEFCDDRGFEYVEILSVDRV